MAAVRRAPTASSRGGGIENIEKVNRLVIQRRQQRLDILIESCEFTRFQQLLGIEFRCKNDLLSTLNLSGSGIVTKIELYSPSLGSDDSLPFSQRVTNAEFTKVS